MNLGVRQCFSVRRPWSLVKCLMWALVIFVQIHEHKGCLEEERIGLLQMKAFLKSHYNIGNCPLSWIEDADQISSDCCGWEGISCNSTTGHVIKLSLHDMKQRYIDERDDFYPRDTIREENIWLLNVSLFQPFKKLTSLDLSYNEIGGCIANEGFERLAVLRSLEVLNLANNFFEDSILPSLTQLSSLTTLVLAGNSHLGNWTTAAGSKSLSRLDNLETLDISRTNFSRSTISSLSTTVKSSSLRNLNLAGLGMEGPLPAQELSAFENLERLDLSDNRLTDGLTPKELHGLSKLSKLKHLILRGNNFGNQTFKVLGAQLPALESLDLSYNYMEGPLSIKEFHGLSKLSKLKHLDLSGNYFGKQILRVLGAQLPALKSLSLFDNRIEGPLSIKDLANFSRLEILDMGANRLNGSISPYIEALSSAKAISLSYNNFNGDFPSQDLCRLKKLEEFDISYNDFEGILPRCINNISSLRVLDIFGNRFIGNLSSSLVANLNPTTIEYIDLSHNLFEGLFSFSSFANHSKLKVVRIMSDNSKLVIETENPLGWTPLFQLTALVLQNCNLNKLTGNIPKFLFDQHRLEEVDLSHNKLKGSFPFWLLENHTRLRLLNLRNNSFEGQFYLQPEHHINVSLIDVSRNHLDGRLQENIGKVMPHLRVLNVSRNHFEGDLPSSVGDMSYLQVLDLSFNRFSGKVPTELVSKCTTLIVLNLQNNNFQGEIFSKHFKLSALTMLQLNSNQFTGLLARSHDWITFNMDMPFDILVEVEFVTKYRSSSYKGGILDYMSALDLSCNKLTGGIPTELGQLSSIHSLNLSHNQLRGLIPEKFSGLASIESLDLSHNSLSGEIPSTLIKLNFMGIFNVAYNNLSGKVPDMKNQFGTFEKSSYEGNRFLCGPPLENGCSTIAEKSNPKPTKSSKASKRKWYEVNPLVFFASFSVSYVIFFSMVASILYINPHWRQMCFNLIEDIMYWSYFTVLIPLKRLSNRLCRH
ncbi:hypothetical protein I3760_07G043200 [Carya illinoinensis]|nr:hypothetical protein I3760_07G043200 [Carya illinoinensis]